MGVDKCRTMAAATMVSRAPESGISDDGVGAVNLFEMEVWEAGDEARNIAAGGLYFHGHGNCVFVVLHAKNYRQAEVGCGIQRLPEFAFAGRTVAERDVGDLVALELDILKLAVIAFGFLGGVRMPGEITAGFGASDGLQNLGASGGRLSNDIESLKGPVRGHLAAAGTGIVGRADSAEQHFVGSGAQGETQGAVAVIRIEPVVGWLQRKSRSDAHGFVAGAGDLEENLLLPLEQDLAVVHAARGEHYAVRINQLLTRQALIVLGLFRDADFVQLGVDFGRGHAAFFTPQNFQSRIIVNGWGHLGIGLAASFELRASSKQQPRLARSHLAARGSEPVGSPDRLF